LLDTSVVELLVLLVVVAGAAAGISVSLAMRKKGSRKTSSLDIEEFDEFLDNEAKAPIQENSADFEKFGDTSTLGTANEESQEQVEHAPSSPPIQLANSFQALETETPDTTSVFTDVVAIEATSHELSTNFTSENTTDDYEEKTPYESSTPVAPIAEETVSSTSTTEDSSFSSPALALPTDNVALQNISPTPLPIGAQSLTPNTFSYGGSNFGNAPSAYCVKCKSKKQIRDPSGVTMKNGRAAISGFCCDCGTRVFRIGRLSTS
jgi:hypothetical protein